ncbi:MAG: polysaccharide biosynthesis C-terminal domain-containing protein [Oscillospiraceae bacterium]|nr:polysaccharide biosynthesis C-terminal domain-containing protein [Oscillospiraceae bacterium]
MKKQTFLQGSLLLTISAIFAKLCGAVFKLPLTAILGGTGMGYFSCAYGLFLPLYAVLVTGLSTAVARPVADFTARKQYTSALKIRQTARGLCFGMGLAGMTVSLIFAKFFTLRTSGSLEAYPAVLAMTPAILFCCLTAVERGYYEGLCSMTPTAVSQAVEAMIKVTAGLFLCKIFLNSDFMILKNYTYESRGAFGAVLGITLSTAGGWFYFVIRNRFQKEKQASQELVLSSGKRIKLLLKIMIPAAMGALVTNLTSLIDLFTIIRSFSAMLISDPEGFYQKAGLSPSVPAEEAAAFVYGSFMGLSVTVFNLVPSLTNMLAKSVLPCTAQAWSAGNRKQAAAYARQVLILTGLLAVPAGCGIFALSEGILEFLFSGRAAEIQAAVPGLQYLSAGLIFLCLSFPVFSLLQAVGREDLPVKVMLPAILVKLICNIFLIPRFCTAGAAISTGICYGLILILALICLKKELGEPLKIIRPLLCQLWGGFLCAGSAWLCYDRILSYLPQRIAFLIAVLIAVLIYFLALFLISQKEIRMLFHEKKFT